MDYPVHGILQARMLEWVAFPFSRGSSRPRSNPGLHTAGGFFTSWTTREAQVYKVLAILIRWRRVGRNSVAQEKVTVSLTVDDVILTTSLTASQPEGSSPTRITGQFRNRSGGFDSPRWSSPHLQHGREDRRAERSHSVQSRRWSAEHPPQTGEKAAGTSAKQPSPQNYKSMQSTPGRSHINTALQDHSSSLVLLNSE